MKIELSDLGKRFRNEWIIRQLTYTFLPGHRYAITGPNGSGKSTLLRLLSGHLTPSRGTLLHSHQQQPIPVVELYRHLAYAAPYIEMIEEFTLWEAIRFHRRFRPTLPPATELLALTELEKSKNKPIRHFSSGMQQRLRLTLSICDTTPLLLLDEPTTNLDEAAQAWYHALLARYASHRTLLIASNDPSDYQICEEELAILDFK